MVKRYTLGVAFDHEENLVLIKKTKPEWQAGLYNFVGGKIERGEKPVECIAREFMEETGVSIEPDRWKYVGKMYRTSDFVVHIFLTYQDSVSQVRTTTEEEVFLCPVSTFEINSTIRDNCMPNLHVIYEFIKSEDFLDANAELNIKFPSVSK
jgi:8-oxo-dGTP diphosphatase